MARRTHPRPGVDRFPADRPTADRPTTDRPPAGAAPRNHDGGTADGKTADRHPGDPRTAGTGPAHPGQPPAESAERALWCDSCEAMVPVGDLDEDDCCPTCGEPVGGPRRVPWKFRLMIAASVVYLGYRAFQGITWVVHHA